eukprot:scpid5253/ scgid3630/ 
MATGDPGGGHPLQDDQSQSPHSLDPQRPVRRSVGNMLSVDNDDGNPAATPVYSYASAVNQGTPVSISSFSTGNARTRQLEEFAKTDSTDGGDDGMKDFPSTLSTENTTYQPTSIGMVDRSKPVQQPSGKFPQQTYSQAASTEAQSMQHCTSTAKLGTVDQDSRHSPSPGNDVQHRECSLTSHATSSATAVTLSSTTLLSESPNSAQLSVVCEGCDEDATCRCLTCQLSLCNECWEDMHRVKKRASHRKVDLLSTGPTRPSSQEPGPFLWDENVEDNYGKDKFDTKPLPAGNITKPFQVYHLIQLHHDLQEQGETVKKWLLDKKTFTRFTSSLGLAENKKSSWPVDSDLQARELATIGLYGNKERISEWLKQRISLCPTDVKMITDESRPGLYCLNNGGNVQYLVFNAPEDAFATISRKNVSCLLLRCLVELCRPLLVFYDKDELSSFRVLPDFGCKEQERVKAVIVKHVVGEKEDISLNPGFSVDVSKLDTSDAYLCRSYNHGYFHVRQSVSNEKRFGMTTRRTLYGRLAKEPLKDIMRKLKLLSDGDTDKLHFSQADILEAENSEENKPADGLSSEQLASCVEDTAALCMMEYCPLACHTLSGIEPLTSEKQRLGESKRTVIENIPSISNAEVGHSTLTLDGALEQYAAPLRRMDFAFASYIGITQTNGIANIDVPAMGAFLEDASRKQNKDDLMEHARQLARTWHHGDLSEERLAQFAEAGIQTITKSLPTYANMLSDSGCEAVVDEHRKQIVGALTKLCQVDKQSIEKGKGLWKKLSSGVATLIPNFIPQTKQEKVKVRSAVLRELKQYLHDDDTSSAVIEDMTFYKSNVQLELQYKIERRPNSEQTRQLYSIEVPEGELAKLKQQPDHAPSLRVFRRLLALPLHATEELRYFAVLKSGKLVAAIESPRQEGCNVFLLPLADFTYTTLPKPVFSTKKSIDMLDYNEDARLMVVHVPSTSGIEFITFTEGLSQGCSNGSYHYSDKMSDTKLTQLLFAPGGQKLHMLFENHTCWTLDVKQRIKKGRHIEVSVPVSKALITPDGVHLLIATDDQADQCVADAPRSTPESTDVAQHTSQICIYSLESRKWVKTLSLPSSSIPSYCLESLQLMSIGSQAYLVALDKRTGTIRLCLTTIKGTTTSIEKTYEMSDDTVAVSHAAKSQRSWNYLDYFHYMYEKFSIEDYFKFCRRRVDICCIVDDDAEDEFNSHVCDEYVDNILEGLDISTRKPRRNFRLSSWYLTFSASLETQLAQTGMSISEWLQRIVCLLPVQIARADANKLSILESGLERDSIVLDQDFPEVYNAINFGLYEDIIKRWPGRVKVMSSMGKQSTGKSYLLNHAAGAMFDISGHRCTKGLWMTMRTMEDCLYVILDFEGLGSVKRTSQEDTLLSVTNAVISGLTVFKTEWAIYKETCEMLNQFKKGVELMKNHPKLLCGWFYVNVRDVKTADCQEVHQEFEENFDQIVNEDPLDNFLIRLYKSQRVVHTFPPIQEPTFYNNIDKIVSYLKSDKTPHLDTGAEFLDMFKQTLAKVHCGVWTDFQDTIIQQKVFHLEQHLETAIANGSIIDENGEKEPLQTDSAMEIPDEPLLPNSASPIDNLPDISISLGSDKGFETLIAPLMKEFEHRHGTRSDADDVEDWTNQFQDFLTAICKRREHRIEMWLQSYVGNYVDGRIDELRKTIRERLEKQELKLCTTTCKECQLPCLQRHRHDATSGHNCLGDHLCHRVCTFCSCSNGETSRFDIHLESKPCVIPAGHRGHHDCSRHTCGKACDLSKRARCRLYCKKKRAHDGKHDCGEPQHLCNEPCKVAECQNKCLIPVSSPAPDSHPGQHNCGTNGCLHRCVMCANPCASDHFHTPDRGGHHFCAKEHDCPEPCNVPNTCRTAYVNRLIGEGRRRVDSGGKTVSVEEKVRDRCGIKIPRNRTKHERPNEHRCGASTTAHTCCAPCPMCHRLCKHPAGHSGRHKTEHGYMWRTVMASATAEFNVGDKKIKRGESGMDQLMCQVYCEKLGRGHTHLVECGARNTASGRCNAGQSEGKRHCADDVKFSDNDTVPKDELMHHAYWEQINFEDPTSKDDQEDFKKCNYRCASKAHDGESPIWCKNQLWHGNPAGDQILQGHKFTCKHAPYHHILLLDTSWSMDATSPAPTDRSLAASHPTRLGVALQCAIQYLEDRYPRSNRDIFSIIPFDDEASPPIRREGRFTLSTLVEELKKIQTTGLTSFNKAFEGAIETMQRFEHTDHQCIIVFLTDGLDEFDDRILERYLQHRKDKTLPLVQMQTILISDSTSTESEVLKRIVNIVKKCYPRCDFATESRAKTYKEAAELVDHYHEIASRINVRGGFMSADVLERAGHRS